MIAALLYCGLRIADFGFVAPPSSPGGQEGGTFNPQSEIRNPQSRDPQSVDFDRDVRPILFGRCVSCHGTEKPKAGLSLTSREHATAGLKSGAHAVVPGKPVESALLARVASTDPEERMPPKGAALSVQEIDALRRWVAGGATWPVHWAYRPLLKPVPPATGAPMIRTDIDRFILKKLLDRGLAPSREADRRTLLRRLTFDLIGLPPSPEEIDAFLADSSPDAYEKVVDRLLASPHYGERWARHWMDVAHFAETHGHDQDRPRDHAWPYRDYLIRAFNRDTPYARFVQDQLAGDVLFPDDSSSLVATGFIAAGPWDESSLRDIRPDTVDRQIGHYLDRDDMVTTAASTFLSTTVHCARCHDHKFDPVPTADYYALQAVFAGVDKANRPFDPDPAVGRKRREIAARVNALEAKRKSVAPELLAPDVTAEVARWEKTVDAAPRWQPVVLLDVRSAQGSTLAPLGDGSVLASGPAPKEDVYSMTAYVDLPKMTGLRLEVLPHNSLPFKGPGRAVNGNLHLSEIAASAAPHDDGTPAAPLRFSQAVADFDQKDWEAPKTIDGIPETAWGVHPKEGEAHQIVFVLKDAPAGGILSVDLKQLHGREHVIGRFRLSATDAANPLGRDSLPASVAAALAEPAHRRDDRARAELAAHVLKIRLEAELKALPARQLAYCGTPDFKADGTFAPAGTPRPVHVLKRGDIHSPGARAEAGALSLLPGLPGAFQLTDAGDEGARRASFARWVSDSRNVLAWRSIANRVWHYHFGRGLVDTPNDFGRMGSPPSHPELLDWLAATLLESGGSLKALHRAVVTSAVYRQSSGHVPEFARIDADNVFLWRMNRRRLDAESVRDAILRLSGKLDATMGGPSVKQFLQTPGIHVTPNVDYVNFNPDDPANFRRSVYRFVFRTLPDPFMETLDCPDASQWAPKRDVSVTALQALSLLNDKFVIRQSEHLAARAAGPREAFVRILGRPPSAREEAAVTAYAARHGLANACRFLLNSNEFMFVD